MSSIDDLTTISEEYELGGPEILTLEEIERRTLQALGKRRLLLPFPMSVLKFFVAVMEGFLPNPPVTRSLLELLQVSNVTVNNGLDYFIQNPRPFTPENTAAYMRQFRVGQTLSQFFSR